MGKISKEDKIRIQTLCEQGWGYKRIVSAYPNKEWKQDSVKTICRRFKKTGSVINRKAGSGRPKAARCAQNIEAVSELICSQDSEPETSKSLREIAGIVGICPESVRNIAKKDLRLNCFKRQSVQVLNDAARKKRLDRSKKMLRRLTVHWLKRTFFTDEKVFYVDPPVNAQTNRVWGSGRKSDIATNRLLVQRAKFSSSVMVSVGVCFGGKGRLHFVPEKTKINAECYTTNLLPLLLEDCQHLLQHDFIFQQDGAPAHTARQSQEWLATHTPDFIKKDEWPPNSPDLNPLDFCVWGLMLEKYTKHKPKPTTREELKVVLQNIWDSLEQGKIDKAVLAFRKRLRACVQAEGGHFEHALN